MREEIVQAGDFETRSVVGDGVAFDHGVDYLRCGNLELAREVGADAFAPYLCLSDIALSEGLGWGLTRTQTLADGSAARFNFVSHQLDWQLQRRFAVRRGLCSV